MIKTNLEHLETLRNTVAFRVIESEANVLCWEAVAKKCKANSQEIVNANASLNTNAQSKKKDKLFLRIIDKEIRKVTKKESSNGQKN